MDSSTVDADGNATAEVTCDKAGVYHVERISVSLTESVPYWKQATCKVYRNEVGPRYLLEVTRSPDGDSTNPTLRLRGSGTVVAVWSNCPPGAVATLVIEGYVEKEG